MSELIQTIFSSTMSFLQEIIKQYIVVCKEKEQIFIVWWSIHKTFSISRYLKEKNKCI